ncbi:MAG TPA: hypothetical protein VGO16_13730 [Pseudonocardiaceae bacterium]|jgi:hypothetical protein|nr:hypothetical protein [Pseudonocardiaceae bacterium]
MTRQSTWATAADKLRKEHRQCWTKGDLVNDHGISDPNWVRLKLPSGATGYVAALYLKATTRATSPTAADTYQTASH